MRSGDMPVVRTPARSTSPIVGRSSPLITLNSVLLPAPLGPMSARRSARSIERETPSSATTPPKRLVTDSTWSSGMFAAASDHRPERREEAGEPARREQHDRDQHSADDEHLPLVGLRGDPRLEQREDRCADDTAPQRLPSAEQHHDEQRHRIGPMQVCQAHERAMVRVQDAGESGDPADENDRPILVPEGGESKRPGAGLVLTRRRQHAPERRAHEHTEREHHCGQDSERAEVERRVADRQLRHDEPVAAAGEAVPLVGGRVRQLREREGHHEEEDAVAAQRERRRDGGEDGGADKTGGERQPQIAAEMVGYDRSRIGADAEVCRLAERDQARVTHEQIERRRRDGIQGHFGRQIQSVAVQIQRRERRDERDAAEQDRARAHQPALPSNPCGRKLNTSAISAKMRNEADSGKNSRPKPSTSATMIAPTKAPVMLPRPPTTTTMSASSIMVRSRPGASATMGAPAAPPKAASAVAAAKVSAFTVPVGTPSEAAMRGSLVTARIFASHGVRIASRTTTKSTTPSAMMNK